MYELTKGEAKWSVTRVTRWLTITSPSFGFENSFRHIPPQGGNGAKQKHPMALRRLFSRYDDVFFSYRGRTLSDL